MPINQVILGGDPLLHSSYTNNIEEQIKYLEAYKQNLETMKVAQIPVKDTLLWNAIDTEISTLNDEQKIKLFDDPEYTEIYSRVQSLVQIELLNTVKLKIESSEEGKTLLQRQLERLKHLKTCITEEYNKEVLMFQKFKEASNKNPNLTYEEFLKINNP